MHGVRIFINKADGELKLEGKTESLPEVVPEIYDVIMEVKEREKLDKELELLAKQVTVRSR